MSQTQSDPAQTTPTTTATTRPAGAATAPPGDDDPLSHLHKMSTTAGLGSGEYVAVNGAAVFALILGLFSTLALFETVLLIVPLASIVVAVMAWRQINQSNGTQTGKGLIAAALLLALGIGGFVVAKETTRGMRTRDDRAGIRAAIMDLTEKTRAGDIAGARTLFSQAFQQNVTDDVFKERLTMVRENEVFGKLQGAEWNELADIQDQGGETYAMTKFKMTFDKQQIDVDAAMHKENGRWVFQNIPTFFPQPQQPGRQ